jgi:acetate kinase
VKAAHLVVLNTGSSTVKYAVFDAEPASGRLSHRSRETVSGALEDAFGQIAAHLDELPGIILGVAHRVVHGGADLTEPVVVDAHVEAAIERLSVLAPLHNPANLDGIRRMSERWPRVPQLAVFDTAFHATMPDAAVRYAIPPAIAERLGIRRFGFQGTSCSFVSRAAARHLARPVEGLDMVIAHIGSGVSVTAVHHGRSVDTTMGMTPLGGAVMATRSGDLDPAAVLALVDKGDMTAPAALELLTTRSGLLGMCGSSDIRDVRSRATAGDEACARALGVYVHRLRRSVGAMIAQLPALDAVVFTAGVGEHDAALREEVLSPLAHFGVRVDPGRNASVGPPASAATISPDGATTAVLVVPTDEELEIARQVLPLLRLDH